MSYAEVIHDLAGEKDKQWLILRREAYEQAAKADAEIAALRAECARKDEALKRLMAASEEVDKAWHYEGNQGDGIMEDHIPQEQELQYALVEATEALTPSDAGKKWAAMARVCEAAEEVSDSRTRTRQFDGSPGVVDEMHLRMKLDALDEALRAMEGA